MIRSLTPSDSREEAAYRVVKPVLKRRRMELMAEGVDIKELPNKLEEFELVQMTAYLFSPLGDRENRFARTLVDRFMKEVNSITQVKPKNKKRVHLKLFGRYFLIERGYYEHPVTYGRHIRIATNFGKRHREWHVWREYRDYSEYVDQSIANLVDIGDIRFTKPIGEHWHPNVFRRLLESTRYQLLKEVSK